MANMEKYFINSRLPTLKSLFMSVAFTYFSTVICERLLDFFFFIIYITDLDKFLLVNL